MSVYLTSYAVYAYLSGVWTDITGDVVVDLISVIWGIADNGPLDRLADAGRMTLTLDNTTGKYSPDNASALAGWSKGTMLELVLTYGGLDYVRFRGAVDEIGIQSGTVGPQRVFVTALDWLNYAAKYPLVNPATALNQTADQALTLIVAGMPIKPLATDYDTGVNVFPALFDTVTPRTLAYTEFSKLVFSEFGYIYLRRDRTSGETLIFENATARNGLRSLTAVPKTAADSGFLLKEDGGYLLKEDGGKLILDELFTFTSDNDMLDLEIVYGKNIINRMTVMAYPKRIDTSVQVLYSLASPMLIGAGQMITFRGNYSDPTGGATVNAISDTMLQPVANTDYKMWTNSDATGTDLTANLTASAVYGTEAPTYTLKNTSAYSAYITKLQARGYGIYSYDHIEVVRESLASYNQYGYEAETLQQQYQRDAVAGVLVADMILEREKSPRTVVKKISLSANQNSTTMQAFLNLDVGDIIHIKEDKAGVDGWYYIQGGDFSIAQGGLISFNWVPRQTYSLLNGLSLVTYYTTADTTGVLMDYGVLPMVNNAYLKRTFSAWVFYTEGNGGGFISIGDRTQAGITISISSSIVLEQGGATQRGTFVATGVPSGKWLHVVVSRDASAVDNLPAMYINGVAVSVTIGYPQIGATLPETGCGFYIAENVNADARFIGMVRDLRCYNRILTAAEVATLYSELPGGTSISDGLVFQGPVVRTSELAGYSNLRLTTTNRLLENVYGVVGKLAYDGGVAFTNPTNAIVGAVVTGTAAAGTSVTLSHYIGLTLLSPNAILIVAVTLRGSESITSVVRGAQSFTLKSTKSFGGGVGDPRVELWYLLAPTPGTTNIVITASAGSFIQAASIDCWNINQTTPFGTVVSNSGTGGTPSVTAASASDDVILDVIGVSTGGIGPYSGQVSQWNATSNGAWRGGGSTKAGAASVLMSWFVGGASPWALLAVAIKKA